MQFVEIRAGLVDKVDSTSVVSDSDFSAKSADSAVDREGKSG